MAYEGLLIDVDFCTGCQACVLACQQERGYDETAFGVQITQVGPYQIGNDEWQYDFVPQFTKWCNRCADRVAKGKQPACVQMCQAQCLEYGEVKDLAKRMFREKQIIVGIVER
ncbi:4Fe-4S dicluster domain-containing protein [Gordonibacter massiliensis (ex Traore et al. 2017)]|uniref:4Fe-4S dicluster domain-containing protein n=1 Tax=Gordonibacter massiliensis (ex Traore et al. 2017) TaxID=1841863 RepID=UPI001C8B9971|nr:4Fe-4S binding protein [Gordonibacter massiliensis (ex Traore et al. 2017)]MBX9033382.1 4Fe-4S binding protein [Gordonibacter massiliensis (ex Traore et al. 2017)]